MKVQIRQGVFETNSSSTHTLCFANKSDWQDWENGKPNLFLDLYTGIVNGDDYKEAYERYIQECKDKGREPLDFVDWMCEYQECFIYENRYSYYDSMEILYKDVPGIDNLVAVSVYAD